jgi:ABC-2 type transport system permease protein
VPGIVALGIGLGAAYPDFKAENPAQTVTSFGGLIFMITCTGYIGLVVMLEAGPVYRLFMADLHGRPLSTAVWLWIVAAFGTAFVLSFLAVILPLRFGEKRLAHVQI